MTSMMKVDHSCLCSKYFQKQIWILRRFPNFHRKSLELEKRHCWGCVCNNIKVVGPLIAVSETSDRSWSHWVQCARVVSCRPTTSEIHSVETRIQISVRMAALMLLESRFDSHGGGTMWYKNISFSFSIRMSQHLNVQLADTLFLVTTRENLSLVCDII